MKPAPEVSFVGAGWVATNCYAPAMELLGARCLLVSDLDASRASALAQRLGGRAGDLGDILAARPHLVVVATPTCTHLEVTAAALAAGHRVLCEKPFFLDPVAAGRALAGAGGRFTTSAPYRRRPDVLAWMDATGALGDVQQIRLTWLRAAGVPRPGSWYTRRAEAGGGVLADLGPHLLDVAASLVPHLPQIRALSACAWTAPFVAAPWMPGGDLETAVPDVESRAALFATTEEGVLITLDVAWQSGVPADRTLLTVEAEGGRAVLRTLFGYAPRPAEADFVLTVDARAGRSERRFSVARDPASDFAQQLAHAEIPPADEVARTLWITDILARGYRAVGAA